MFKKSGFLRSGYPDGSGTIRGPSGGQGESVEAKKAKIRIFEKSGFPGPGEPDPDIVLRERWGGRGLPVAKISDL